MVSVVISRPQITVFTIVKSMIPSFTFKSSSNYLHKVEKILKGSLDSIPSPSHLGKIQIMGRKIYLKCKGKILLGVVDKLLKTKRLLKTPSNVLPLYVKQTFLPIICIYTKGDRMGWNPGYLLKSFLLYYGILLPKLWLRKTYEIRGWRPRIFKIFEIKRTIY